MRGASRPRLAGDAVITCTKYQQRACRRSGEEKQAARRGRPGRAETSEGKERLQPREEVVQPVRPGPGDELRVVGGGEIDQVGGVVLARGDDEAVVAGA